jgi:hypothetical protein
MLSADGAADESVSPQSGSLVTFKARGPAIALFDSNWPKVGSRNENDPP